MYDIFGEDGAFEGVLFAGVFVVGSDSSGSACGSSGARSFSSSVALRLVRVSSSVSSACSMTKGKIIRVRLLSADYVKFLRCVGGTRVF